MYFFNVPHITPSFDREKREPKETALSKNNTRVNLLNATRTIKRQSQEKLS